MNRGRAFALSVSLALAVMAVGMAAYFGYRIGFASGCLFTQSDLTFRHSAPLVALPRSQRLLLSVREAFGLRKFYSTNGQDKWIVQIVFPGVTDGFYVDVGAGDGTRDSNTKVLDEIGWKGICIDPFPTNMDTRTAEVFREVVYSEGGRTVRFRASGFLGGIEEHLDHTKGWKGHRTSRTLEFTTTTLDEILSKARAPSEIHYMSLDIEGAELEALRGLSLSKYRVKALTIEHNWEEPKRRQIRRLLESHGYRNVFARYRDDYYVLERPVDSAGEGSGGSPEKR
jgi:FkbM family methyltransferase